MVTNPVCYSQMKHIAIKYHFLWEVKAKEEIWAQVVWNWRKDNGDISMVLPREKFWSLRSMVVDSETP